MSTGVMTKRDFVKKNYDQWLMSYNGMVYDKIQSEAYYNNWVYNTSRSDEERREAMKYTIGGANNMGLPRLSLNCTFQCGIHEAGDSNC